MKRPKSLRRGARVLVHWRDIIASGAGWDMPKDRKAEMRADYKKPHIVTVGFVLDATKRYLAVVPTIAVVSGGQIMHSLQIPWGNVRSVARLKVGKDY